jgi:hypothetical protein
MASDALSCTCDPADIGGLVHRGWCETEHAFHDGDEWRTCRFCPEVQWCVFWGGPDPDNCAGLEITDELAAAEENVQWRVEAGIARRTVTYGPWEVVGDE